MFRVTDNWLSTTGVKLLRHAYIFVNERWQHVDRQPIPDQGFEEKFRENCVHLGWVVSQHRELNLGTNLSTMSSVLHEIDLVVHNEEIRGIFELKNRSNSPPEKNDVIVFWAKLLDYLCINPELLKQSLVPIFLSAFPFEYTGLGACLGLGLHPIAPGLRPIPLLVDNARRMKVERDKGLQLPDNEWDAYEEFAVATNSLASVLDPLGLNQRCDILNESTITIRTVGVPQTVELGDQLRSLNAECTRLIDIIKAACVRSSG